MTAATTQRRVFVPHLSATGNRDEFNVPSTPMGDIVCKLPLTWGLVEGRLQACINMPDLLTYPGYKRLTREEAITHEPQTTTNNNTNRIP